MSGRQHKSLFAGEMLHGVLEQRRATMERESAAHNTDQVLAISPADLAQSYVDRYRLEPIVLREDEISASDPVEGAVESHDRYAARFGESGMVQGFRVSFTLPFHGSSEILKLSPNSFGQMPIYGTVSDDRIHFHYEVTRENFASAEKQFDSAIAGIKDRLRELNPNVEHHNRIVDRCSSISKRPSWRRSRRARDGTCCGR